MTREEFRDYVEFLRSQNKISYDVYSELIDGIDTLEQEPCDVKPLTDTEQRIFLAAMSREEKVCKEVCKDGDGKDLVAVCHRIERKVKKALWG